MKLDADMAKMVERYGNPQFRRPITYIKIAPIGLVVSLVTAFFLGSQKLERDKCYGNS
jgi:hypothetical protein